MSAAGPPSSARLLVDCRCTLGEGLVWSASRQAWFWLDITQARLWSHDTRRNVTCDWRLPDRAGAFAFTESGAVVLGLRKGLAIASVDRPAGSVLSVTPLTAVEPSLVTLRINDGRTDRAGNFVFGTMNDAAGHAAIGSIFQFSPRHGLRRLALGNFGIANSICFSPNGERVFFCDSPRRRIMQAAYDADRAAVSNVTPFVVLTGDALPDGSIVDADGCLWNAEWNGSAVRRYDPNGRLLDVLAVPVPHATCPAFGGSGLSTLAVTTAREEMSDDELVRTPTAGGLFDVGASHGVAGLADAPMVGL